MKEDNEALYNGLVKGVGSRDIVDFLVQSGRKANQKQAGMKVEPSGNDYQPVVVAPPWRNVQSHMDEVMIVEGPFSREFALRVDGWLRKLCWPEQSQYPALNCISISRCILRAIHQSDFVRGVSIIDFRAKV